MILYKNLINALLMNCKGRVNSNNWKLNELYKTEKCYNIKQITNGGVMNVKRISI